MIKSLITSLFGFLFTKLFNFRKRKAIEQTRIENKRLKVEAMVQKGINERKARLSKKIAELKDRLGL